MGKISVSFQAALRRWAEEKRREHPEALPDPEDLVAYREGTITPEAGSALRRKLALSPQAAREYLDLTSFRRLQPPNERYRLTDRDVENALTSIRRRILREGDRERDSNPR